jgi:hypothetical protein
MTEARHKAQTVIEGLHSAISFEYIDAAARLAAGPFEEYDKNKFAIQLDDDGIYILTATDPIEWKLVSGTVPAGNGVLGPETTTNNAVVLWDGTDGYYLKNSSIIIDGYNINNVEVVNFISDGYNTNISGDIVIDGTLKVTGQIYPIATPGNGWFDIIGLVIPPGVGPTIPVLTAVSAPHGNFRWPLFALNDVFEYRAHIPHGIDAAAGIYLHVHMAVDGIQTGIVKFEFEYTYAHGYSRQQFSSPLTTTCQQAATGVAKTHQILEISSPILVNQIETDGILCVICKRVTNGGTDVTNNVFVPFVDAHIRLKSLTSTNRNYPFE